jgi:Uma2 family endonuclease
MVQTPTLIKTLSLDEFLKLPETKPASEYINGDIIQKPMPQGKHSLIQSDLIINLNAIARPTKIALALSELRCNFGGRSIVPDVVILRYNNIPRDPNGDIANVINQAPDWTIEILSPDQNTMKVTNNILHCLNHGCSLGWLIDPESKTVLIFQRQQQPIFLENDSEIIPVPEFLTDFKLTIGDLFGWLKV